MVTRNPRAFVLAVQTLKSSCFVASHHSFVFIRNGDNHLKKLPSFVHVLISPCLGTCHHFGLITGLHYIKLDNLLSNIN